ncbi:AAA family ATPase [Streptomyces mirabilis]|uniref:nSTAND1 domain-containing NTPase n=1 Tax=Streptomyces mirabilis TaxID=68239 RepID=UPI00369F680D
MVNNGTNSGEVAAVPRGERPLDAEGGPLAEFASGLRELRQKAGNPTYRVLAQRAHYSIATLSAAAAGHHLPTRSVALAYVRACAGDEEQWARTWHETATRLAAAEPRPPSASNASDESGGAGESGEDTARPPYAGLASFQRADADCFFGRERFVSDLADRLRHGRLLALFGASGSGKSSILRAGLLPLLADAVVFTPGWHPLEECAIQLSARARDTPGRLLADLSADPLNLHRAVRQFLADRPENDAELVLVIDQFEEVFTLCTDPAERTAFIAALVRAAQAPNSRCRVVIAVRADFYAHCTRHPDLVEALHDAQIPVGPMSTAELRRAIVQPALRAGLTVEGALLAHLTAEAKGQPGVLPLLSHALLETWHRRRGNALTLAGFQAAGSIEGALAQTAEALYTQLNRHQQQLARQIFLRLTALGEGTEDTKRRLTRAELDETDDTALVLERAARARLLTLDDNRVEIAHEALIRCWPRLTSWLTEDRDRLRTHRRLTEATDIWESFNHDPGALYRGVRLATARELPRTDLTRRERDFLDASTAAEVTEATLVRRRLQRVRQLAALLVLLLLAAGTAFGYAVHVQHAVTRQRNVILAQRVADQAVALHQDNPSLAAQLSLAAYRLAPDDITRDGLLSATATPLGGNTSGLSTVALGADGHTLVTSEFDGTVRLWDITHPHHPAVLSTFTAHAAGSAVIALSPDGTTLASGSSDSTVRVWDISDPRHPVPYGPALRGHTQAVFSVAFSPDGKTVASGSYDHTVRLWDVTDPHHPAHLATLTGHTLNVKPVAFSPDGRTLASGSDDRTVRLWNIADPRHPTPLATLTGHKDFVDTLAFSPDGRTLASGSDDRTVRLWNIADPRHPALAGILTGYADVVADVAFSRDGRTLATGSYDRTVRVWNVADLRHPTQLAMLTGDTSATQSVAFTTDGTRVISGSADHTAQIWETTVAAATARACALTRRTITRAEWRHYLPGTGYRPPCPGSPPGRGTTD